MISHYFNKPPSASPETRETLLSGSIGAGNAGTSGGGKFNFSVGYQF
jgi:hypothetical protein